MYEMGFVGRRFPDRFAGQVCARPSVVAQGPKKMGQSLGFNHMAEMSLCVGIAIELT